MNYHYKANKVSLHVRKSNRGAIRLYEELLGYKVAGVASSYYSDGEDAFVMEAELPEVDTQVMIACDDRTAAPLPWVCAHVACVANLFSVFREDFFVLFMSVL